MLERIGVNHRSIKAGFECVHSPSIDLNSVAFSPRPDQMAQYDRRPSSSAGQPNAAGLSSSPESPTLDRRRSIRRTKMGLPRSPFSKDRDLDKDAGAGASQASFGQTRNGGTNATGASSSSFTVLSNANATANGVAGQPSAADGNAAAGETSFATKYANNQMIGDSAPAPGDAQDMIVRFEIFIIKVPWLPGLHGIQFRRITGSAWQYSQLGGCGRE